MFPVRYVLGFCVLEDDILSNHRSENLISYVSDVGWKVMTDLVDFWYRLFCMLQNSNIFPCHIF
jgi:hypothetical protein